MSDRLAELVRQRALVQEHLAWLNREIAAAAEAARTAPTPESQPAAPAAVTPSAPPVPGPSATDATAPATTPPGGESADADAIIARYQVAPTALKQDVRMGCLLYFAGAFVLLGLLVTVLYLAIGRRP